MKFKIFKLLLIFTCMKVMAHPFDIQFKNPQQSGYINFFYKRQRVPFQVPIVAGIPAHITQDNLNNVAHFDIHAGPIGAANTFVATITVEDGHIVHRRDITFNNYTLFTLTEYFPPNDDELLCLSPDGRLSPSGSCSMM